jgi:two-component system chemotaxis sensor kinase CheA
MIDKFKATFLDEAAELLSQLEDTLLGLESRSEDDELINKAFRAMHTIKGSAAMFGFDAVSLFTHEVETALDRCRNGTLTISQEFIGLTLRSRDHIRRLLEYEIPPNDIVESGVAILEGYRSYMARAVGIPPLETKEPVSTAVSQQARSIETGLVSEESLATFRIYFRPSSDVFRGGTRVLNLVEELVDLDKRRYIPTLTKIPRAKNLIPRSVIAPGTWCLRPIRARMR